MSLFWSAWIIGLTISCTVLICWLLFANRKTQAGSNNTTGHVYDGIEEYDNPLPLWWFYLFVATLVFGAGYLVFYPGLGAYAGVLGWSKEGQLAEEVARADARYGPLFAKYAAMPIPEVARDPQARKMGQRLFANYCAQCHGADARGSYGFPDLTDDDWLYGNQPEQLVATIAHGRTGAMPAWEAALGDEGVEQVVAYVTTLSGRNADPQLAAAGKEKYGMFCASCHGPEGHGNQQLGAPDLTDNYWLYGGSKQQLQQTIRYGRSGRMPAWEQRLGAEKVHLLAAYIYGLSQAENAQAQPE